MKAFRQSSLAHFQFFTLDLLSMFQNQSSLEELKISFLQDANNYTLSTHMAHSIHIQNPSPNDTQIVLHNLHITKPLTQGKQKAYERHIQHDQTCELL